MMPFVTILIPVRNMARYIEACLDSLLAQDYPKGKYEILVLDNSSEDGTIGLVSKYPAPVRLIQMGVHSPAKKYNQIIPRAKGSVLGFVDGDAVLEKSWLKHVVVPLENPHVAGASGNILTANTDSTVARVIGYELHDRYSKLPPTIERVATMHVVYKKDVLLKIGGFNEKLKTGYDCEIGYRINDAGYKIAYVPNATVYHNHRSTLQGYFWQQFEYGQYALPRYLKSPKIARGDSVTSSWMILQAPVYGCIAMLFLLASAGLLPSLYPAVLSLALLGFYGFEAGRLSLRYRDLSAFLLLVLYPLRVIGWGLGATHMLGRIVFTGKVDAG